MTTAIHGRPPVAGSLRNRILMEMERHPKGLMAREVADILDSDVSGVRNAMHSLAQGGFLVGRPAGGRGGGGSTPFRYWHKMHAQKEEAPAPVVSPVEAPSYQNLGNRAWVDNYLGAR